MKKLFLLLLVFMLVLCSCGKQEEVITGSTTPLYYLQNEIYGYTVYEDHVELTDFFGSAYETVEIPAEFYDSQAGKNKPLTVIGNSAFNYDSGARYVTIPDTVVEIKTGAFRDCGGIETITFGKNVKIIGNSAFSACSTIKELVIPDSVEEIGDYAFYKCSSVAKLEIGKNVFHIGENAFEGCVSLEEISGGEGLSVVGASAFLKTPWLDSLSEDFAGIENVLIEYNGTDSEIVIPDSFTSVSDAFSGNTEITSVTFPDKFKTIGNNAFSGCSSLETVNIPKSVDFIGCSAFAGTPYIDNLQSEDGFCIVGDSVLLKYTGDSTSLKIPDNVKHISDAFFGNETLVEVNTGDNTETIGRDAFSECSALNMVVISPSVKHIDKYAFSDTDITQFITSGNAYAKEWAEDAGLKNAIE